MSGNRVRRAWVIAMVGQRGEGVDGTSDFITRGKMNAVCVSQIPAWDPLPFFVPASERILCNPHSTMQLPDVRGRSLHLEEKMSRFTRRKMSLHESMIVVIPFVLRIHVEILDPFCVTC